ncbi:MAG: hypothetical protein JO352_30615 [Chloroflexi bacterium]|nr:hypothetical protein [Chloroflexota bacterium]MBV9596138.1 hypothetical protein [Chloroflexota bacterium]
MVRLNVFFRGANSHFVENYYDADGWHWHDWGFPDGQPMASALSAVSWAPEAGRPAHLNVYCRTNTGNLLEHAWDGHSWKWTVHAQPPPGFESPVGEPAAVAWAPFAPEYLNVFSQSNGGHLVDRFWNGETWIWNDLWNGQRQPTDGQVASTPTPVWFVDAVEQLVVFFASESGHLLEAVLGAPYPGQAGELGAAPDALTFRLVDHGLPPGTIVQYTPAAVAWDADGVPRLNVFMAGTNGNLLERWWGDGQWQWADHGQPPGSQMISPPTAVTWTDGAGAVRINLFFLGSNGNFVERWWDGGSWQWHDWGQPPGTAMGSQPAAVTWSDGNGVAHLNVFCRGENGALLEHFWDGNAWHWNNHGLPPGTSVDSYPSAVSWNA